MLAILSQKNANLIRNVVFILLALPVMALATDTYKMANPETKKISLRLALTRAEQTRGLSGLKPSDFKSDEGMLFVNAETEPRQFWMPDTYFNLDIIFLDPTLTIVGLEKNVPFHPGLVEPPVIFRTKSYRSQFVLETKAGVEFSKKLKVGDRLKWEGTTSLSEIILKTRRSQ